MNLNFITFALLLVALLCCIWKIGALYFTGLDLTARADAAEAREKAEMKRADELEDRELDLKIQLADLQAKSDEEQARLLTRIAELERDKHAMECTLATSRAMHEIERQRAALPARPARFSLEAALPEESIAELLAGTDGLPTMRAVFAHVSAEIVRLSDRSTDEPRDTVVLPDRIIPGYSADQRLHDAGGASHLAALLAKLQDLTKPRPQNQETEKEAA